MDEDNRVYYKIFKSPGINNKLTIITMQWFDENQYEQKRFFKDKQGNQLEFEDKEKAVEWLLDNIKEELIDEEYLKCKIMKDEDYLLSK
jgi:hypothetical protein